MAQRVPRARLEALPGPESRTRRTRDAGRGRSATSWGHLHRDRHLRDPRRRSEVSRLEQLQVALEAVVAAYPRPTFAGQVLESPGVVLELLDLLDQLVGVV